MSGASVVGRGVARPSRFQQAPVEQWAQRGQGQADPRLGRALRDAQHPGDVVKGGHTEWIVWGRGTALLLPRYLKGRARGPLFCADRRRGPLRRATTTSRDVCPETGRARLGYDRARVLIKQHTGLSLHTLRHSAATHLGEAGADTTIIMAKATGTPSAPSPAIPDPASPPSPPPPNCSTHPIGEPDETGWFRKGCDLHRADTLKPTQVSGTGTPARTRSKLTAVRLCHIRPLPAHTHRGAETRGSRAQNGVRVAANPGSSLDRPSWVLLESRALTVAIQTAAIGRMADRCRRPRKIGQSAKRLA
jgi:hypothetical protein